MQPCNRIYYSKIYWRLNMLRAAYRSSSGAPNGICSLWFIYLCGDRPLSRLGGISARPGQWPVTTWIYKPDSITRLYLVGYFYWFINWRFFKKVVFGWVFVKKRKKVTGRWGELHIEKIFYPLQNYHGDKKEREMSWTSSSQVKREQYLQNSSSTPETEVVTLKAYV